MNKLPPIDSDLYTQPSDSLSHLNFDSYSLPGQFVRPRPNQFQTFASVNAEPFTVKPFTIFQYSNHFNNDSFKAAPSLSPSPSPPVKNTPNVSYTATTTTTENQYKTDFGYKVVPKPTEAVKTVIVPVTEPVRPFIPIFDSYSR